MSANSPVAITDLLEKCKKYHKRTIALEELKQTLWEAAISIERKENYQLRKTLEAIEGRLDIVQFTTDSEGVFDATIPIITELELTLNSAIWS